MTRSKMTPEKALRSYEALRRKIDRFIWARFAAEVAFEKLKRDPEVWAAVCKAANLHEACDFGDLTC